MEADASDVNPPAPPATAPRQSLEEEPAVVTPDGTVVLSEKTLTEVAGFVETLVEVTADLPPQEAWEYAQQAIAGLLPGAVREATWAAAQARFKNEPGVPVDGSVLDTGQGSYATTPGYRSALLGRLRQSSRDLLAMGRPESLADPPVRR